MVENVFYPTKNAKGDIRTNVIQKDHILPNTLDRSRYLTLGIVKAAIRPPIFCPIKS
jgi:hypothetical protein